jgi:glutamyl/glutaminyl-tRNA synthetase
MEDIDIAREYLQLEYPTFDKSDIDLEMKNFLPDDSDLENEADLKRLNLKKYATKGRAELESLRSELEKPSMKALAPEIQEKINFARNKINLTLSTVKKSKTQHPLSVR